MNQNLTTPAFDEYRRGREPQPMHSDAQRYQGDTDPMSPTDGLENWRDGGDTNDTPAPAPPVLDGKPEESRLWVVMDNDVLHAPELCDFGSAREAQCVKHSNLTGGQQAYAGGEFVFLDDKTVVLNGCSGRYRIRTLTEMSAIETAFRKSGYRIWSMGWNDDTNRPALFGTQDPIWVRL